MLPPLPNLFSLSLFLSLSSNHFAPFCLLSLNSFHCFEIVIACLLSSLKAKIFTMISYRGTAYLSFLRSLHFKLCLVAEKINCTVCLNYALSKKKNMQFQLLGFNFLFVFCSIMGKCDIFMCELLVCGGYS